MLEAGLVEHYKYTTWTRMKTEYLEKVKAGEEERIIFSERPLADSLSMDDLQGLFYLAGILGFCPAILVFIIEYVIGILKSRHNLVNSMVPPIQ